MQEIKNAEIFEDLISKKPTFFVRNGGVICAIVFFLIVLLLTSISYPTISVSDVKLTYFNPPAEIRVPRSGIISQILKSHGTKVRKGEIIAVLQTNISYEEIRNLYIKVNKLKSDVLNDKGTINFVVDANSSYGNFAELILKIENTISSYNLLNEKFSSGKLHDILKQKIKYLNEDKQILYNKLLVAEKIDSIAKEKLFRYEKLFTDSTIAFTEYSDNVLLNKQLQLISHNVNHEIYLNRDALSSLKIKESEMFDEVAITRSEIVNLLKILIVELEKWKKENLIIASINGKVQFTSFINENSFIETGGILCYLEPEGGNVLIGNSIVPHSESGNLKVGQKAIIKLSGYSYQKYGTLKGYVSNVSNIMDDRGLSVEITINTMDFFQKNKIKLKNNSIGKLEIELEQSNLLKKLLFKTNF